MVCSLEFALEFSKNRNCIRFWGYSLLELSWSRPGSNRRPPACKAGALPVELLPRNMGTDGFEPSTSRLSSVRSNQLSYEPKSYV